MKTDVVKKQAKNLALNFIGSTLLAFGVCAFIVPFNIIVGGSTGIALILHTLTGINVSVFALALNLLVLPIGYFFDGKELVIGSILSSLFYPFSLAIFERIPALTTLADDILLASICAGIVCGAGIGLVMKSGGSTGGVDIPCLIVSKKSHVPINKVFNVCDSVIMIAQIPFSNVKYIIYGLIYTFIMTHSLQTVLTFGEDRVKCTVVSERFEEIADYLIKHDFGVTMLYAESGYTKTPIKVIETVMRSYQNRFAIRLIEEIDPEAFITVQKVKDVKGRGFTLEKNYITLDDYGHYED
ncbi:MAG: YitT family protein [Eubacteriales bacterium]|nr:YitT family protein [Eubacteriales bacterium]